MSTEQVLGLVMMMVLAWATVTENEDVQRGVALFVCAGYLLLALLLMSNNVNL